MSRRAQVYAHRVRTWEVTCAAHEALATAQAAISEDEGHEGARARGRWRTAAAWLDPGEGIARATHGAPGRASARALEAQEAVYAQAPPWDGSIEAADETTLSLGEMTVSTRQIELAGRSPAEAIEALEAGACERGWVASDAPGHGWRSRFCAAIIARGVAYAPPARMRAYVAVRATLERVRRERADVQVAAPGHCPRSAAAHALAQAASVEWRAGEEPAIRVIALEEREHG